MLKELQTSHQKRIAVDLTEGGWPWQHWIAGMDNDDVVGPGVALTLLEVESEWLCPYTGIPMINFVAVRVDGNRVVIHAHRDNYERLRFLDAKGNVVYTAPRGPRARTTDTCNASGRKIVLRVATIVMVPVEHSKTTSSSTSINSSIMFRVAPRTLLASVLVTSVSATMSGSKRCSGKPTATRPSGNTCGNTTCNSKE